MTPAESIAQHYQMRTVDQIIAELAVVTDAERSLAFSPLPPPEYREAADCRIGADCGIDFSFEGKRAQWVRARHRVLREMRLR